MRRWIRFALALVPALLAAPASAQDARSAIVVLPFEDGGSYGQDKENFEALRVGIPALLASTLERHPSVRIVDRAQALALLGSANLGSRGRIDAATAAKIGAGTGARYAVTGSFVDFYGRLRLNARLVDVESGRVLQVVSNEDPKLQDRAQLGQIIRLVAERLLAEAQLSPLPADAAGAAATPTDALILYSRALLQHDRGKTAEAAALYQKALDIQPGFVAAQEGLQKARAAS